MLERDITLQTVSNGIRAVSYCCLMQDFGSVGADNGVETCVFVSFDRVALSVLPTYQTQHRGTAKHVPRVQREAQFLFPLKF